MGSFYYNIFYRLVLGYSLNLYDNIRQILMNTLEKCDFTELFDAMATFVSIYIDIVILKVT